LFALGVWGWLAATGTHASFPNPAASHGPAALLHDHRHSADACAGEPELPAMLELEISKLDPRQLKVRVLPGMDAVARLEVESDAPSMNWVGGPAPAMMALARGGSARNFTLDVAPRHDKKASRVRVGLVVEDEQGNISLTVHREAVVGGIEESDAPVSVETMGVSAEGLPVAARVPAGAPAPRIAEGGQ
jgi:hypothetical protein